MRIGIDAKWYFNGPPSGRNVVRHLVHELVRLNQSDEIILFLDRQTRGRTLPVLGANVRPVYVWAGNNLISNVFLLPIYEHQLAIDVMVLQNFPSFLPGARRIAYIHDVLFLSYPQFFTWIERLYFCSLAIPGTMRRWHLHCVKL